MNATLTAQKMQIVPVVFSDLGSLRLQQLQQLELHLYRAFGDGQNEKLIVDCRVVQNVGAAFAGILARLDMQIRRAGSEMVLVELSDSCRRVLQRCGLQGVFDGV